MRYKIFLISAGFIFMLGIFIGTSRILFHPQMTLLREIKITMEGQPPIKPNSIAMTEDGDFLIAGNIVEAGGSMPWAAKVTSLGTMKWYHVKDASNVPSRIFQNTGGFKEALASADGQTLLIAQGTLTKLDRAGQSLGDIDLENNLCCAVPWRGGWAIVGIGTRVDRSQEPPFEARWYELISLDGKGNRKWERQIPIGNYFSALSVGRPLETTNSALVFSATDSINTEVIRLNESGNVQARSEISGGFVLVHPVTEDPAVQLIGSGGVGQTVISLDEK